MSLRRKRVAKNTPTHNGRSNQTEDDQRLGVSHIAPALLDVYTALSMVLGGCCSNVLVYEQLLLMNLQIGSALTFSQAVFVTALSLPSFLSFSSGGILPRLKSRQVPLTQWGLQVFVFTASSLLNNWSFAYNVPLPLQIVFRSAGRGLPISMIFGFVFLKKRYSIMQIVSVGIVTAGVVLATLSRTSSPTKATETSTFVLDHAEELRKYAIGVSMLVVSLICTGFLGLLQERTYRKYGPCWKEGVFYTHFLSLPAFIFLGADVKQGIASLSSPTSSTPALTAYLILLVNLFTQLFCVSGVNRLSSKVSSVSTNIGLTARKALSLCFSVWWFGNDWNSHLGIGACMVFIGSILYTFDVNTHTKRD
ncbi:hypothetical protein K443DRAFT_132839 [Laccaria amethystina LaAM-08-1]|uniref:UAA transporter n=1 Tax=Laccaria amethystina LaAM-08-1 TaxID=1095629 RepID=A0A0C9WPR6_9AGAR|nr:hypothetical protein K443DRAFT_132839 [Laccaria amethystina LaAM-08-1]